MKKTIIRLCGFVLAAAAAVIPGGCADKNVETPKQSVLLDKSAILSTTMGADFDVNVKANCNWEVRLTAEAAQWIEPSVTGGFGNKTVKLSVTTNDTPSMREAVIEFAATGSSAKSTLLLKQPAATGNISIADIRMLQSNLTGETTRYTIADDWKLSAVVNTPHTFANLPDITFGIQDAKTAHSGIMLRPSEPLWKQFGTEIEISLKDAVLTRDENGVLEIQPASDESISDTATDNAQISPVPITREQLLTGDYESMYVAVERVQVVYEDLSKGMVGKIRIEDRELEQFAMYVYGNAFFYERDIPTGSGNVAGLSSIAADEVVILPMSTDDFAFSDKRFGLANGITLPYVFSLLSADPATEKPAPANAMRYNTMRMTNGSMWTNFFTDPPAPQIIEPTDGSGVSMTFWRHKASATGNANNGIVFASYAGNLDNVIALQIWGADAGTAYPYVLLTYPVGEPVSGTVYLSFCLAGSGYGPRNWTVQYSDDNTTWMNAGNVTLATSTDVPNFFTVPVTLPAPLDKGSLMYIKLSQADHLRIAGTENASEGGVGRLVSSIVLQQPDNTPTQFPTSGNVIYTEGFDGLFGGVDYLSGDRLCNMKVYAGDNFAEWNTAKSAGFTAENVGTRPGYVQIGRAEFNNVQPRNLKDNMTGSLTTPAMPLSSVPTDITVSFKAMAYKTGSTMSNAADKSGDNTILRIEVIGGGTIDGRTFVEKSGMGYDEFQLFEVAVSGATDQTRIKFTSPAASAGEFTRWFLDEIMVVGGDPSPEPDPLYGPPDTPGSGMPETDPHTIN